MYKSASENYHKKSIFEGTKYYNEIEDEWNKFWRNVNFRDISCHDMEIGKLLEKISEVYCNGGVILKSILAENIKGFPMLNYIEETVFFVKFFQNNSIVEMIEEFNLSEGLIFSPKFEKIELKEAKDKLLNMLIVGGAYKNLKEEEASKIVQEFINKLALSKNNKVFLCKKYWNTFFFDVAWDYTFIFLDIEKKVIHLFAVADTD